MASSSLRFFKKYGLSVLWAIFILFACGVHPTTLNQLHLRDLFAYDKPIHAFLFGMQAWLIIRANKKYGYRSSYQKMIANVCLFSAAYGALIEFMQLYIFTGRSYDYYDMIADAFGAFVVWLWQRKPVINIR